jgi:predicted DNA-binding antitoxin AbrB/MazE fold protein
MTTQTFDAVFEKGIFRPLESNNITIPEGQRVRLVVEKMETPANPLELAMHVYDGLSEEQIDELEKIILDRRNFFGDRALP